MKTSGSIVRGVCPVVSATFHEQGSLDVESFSALCEHVLGTRVQSLMIFGVATENSKLTDSERETMLKSLVTARGSLDTTIVATVADHGTRIAQERARRWVEMGADSINILPSYFLRPSKEEVLDHVAAILESVTVPVILQSLPSGGDEVPLRDFLELNQTYGHLRQVKIENLPASPLVSEVTAYDNGQVSALVGWGGLEWLEATQAGAVGVQPGCSLTELYLDAQSHLDNNDLDGFASQFSPLRPALTAWMRHPEVLIAIEKFILYKRGIIATDTTRRPSSRLLASDYELAEEHIQIMSDRQGASR